MKRETLLTVAVAVLFLLNAGTLGFLWLGRMSHHLPPHHRPPIDGILMETLQFTPEQQEKFEEMKHDHRSKMIKLDMEYDAAVGEYFNLLRSDAEGVATRDSSERRIGGIQTKRAQITLEHFAQLKAMCTAEQQQKFDSVIPKLVQIMTPPRHPRGGQPPH
jgi:Spy/CpxP family protein refolding chaperone